MDPTIAAGAAEIAVRAERELEALVGVSTPSGDVPGAEEAIAICTALLPVEASVERPACSTPGCAPDLLARIPGHGRLRVLLLGHVDTVFPHETHVPLRREGERLHGPGGADMKGGVVMALGLARLLSMRPELFAELAVLLVTDEEWRTSDFVHVERFAGYDACLCFEAGERATGGAEAVIVRRKAAGTLRITASGQAAHSGSAPDQGRNALLALAQAAMEVSRLHDPHGPQRRSVVPTVMRSGQALNVVPAAGELMLDVRADQLDAFAPVLAAVPRSQNGVTLAPALIRKWPGMDTRAASRGVIERAGARIGRPIAGTGRGGASDASHFAAAIPLTIDGLGPRGGGAHTSGEFVLAPTLRERAEVALAIALEILGG
jgi:glutamate carboxypeptidase